MVPRVVYAEEVKKQGVIPEMVKVEISTAIMKAKSANWLISSWHTLEQRPKVAINGFKAGIVDAIEEASCE